MVNHALCLAEKYNDGYILVLPRKVITRGYKLSDITILLTHEENTSASCTANVNFLFASRRKLLFYHDIKFDLNLVKHAVARK